MTEENLTQDSALPLLAPTSFDSDADPVDPVTRDGPPSPADLQAVFDVPVRVQAVLGRSRMTISNLLRLKTGDVIELDRRVGEPADIFVNNRLIARGEVVLIDGTLGVTLTEIVHQDRS
ncbi:flagellar motor switch protein FliN [Sphingomonas endophytica]|uniref:Flagellar motor switch protein FliN n=1 Tax=Sphingomonas endophytica TaxID=869719 RepID=A0A7X0MNI7_9SPHN|nr:flagellar motor switch protein FliN [Sphingomonas endophytica]MBB5725640.1 flagellar motor switch protein FliN/FliY [Sphingomonas endophytica]MBB6505399.1 flagellar motor switch protein FliN/FliY [Sphingomonas endophytica]